MNYNQSKLLKPYENKWVALTPDLKKVRASGDNLREVEKKLSAVERRSFYFKKVIPHDAAYAPFYL